MTAKKTVVLRTVFNDKFVVGNVEITQDGTEVSTSDAEKILEAARLSRVTLHEVEATADTPTTGEGGA